MRLAQSSQTKIALGGGIALTLVSNVSAGELNKLFTVLWHYIYVFEKSFSRFIPMSELSLFNRSAGLQMSISPGFKQLLESAKSMAEITDGLYNPFILPALQRAGYKRSAVPGYETDSVDDYSHRRVEPIEQLKIGDTWASIPPNTAIDLGGCGKGYLADKLGQLLVGSGVNNYRLSLGGDISTLGVDENGQNWKINIQDADNLEGQVDWTVICPTERFAVATSGTFRRQGQTTDRDWHHIIDPITLQPARTDIRLATVCADTALMADVLASCAVIVGLSDGIGFLKKQGAISMLLQAQDDTGVLEKNFGHYIIKESKGEGLKSA